MCSGCGMQHTSGEDPASSYKTRRSLTEERRLLTLCREPASDKESQPQRPARERNESAGGAQRERCFRGVEGIESAAIERGGDVDVADNGPYVVGRGWTAKAVRGARMRERGASLLTSAAHNSGGLFGQALH